MVNEHKDMEDLYNAMIESSKSSSRPCIILDCLSFLLYNGYSLKSIVMLVTKLAHYIIAAQGTLIVFAHNDSADDKDQLMMCDWLRYEAHSVINVAPLASGVSEGISGQMEISVNKKKSLLLYKQHDTGVSIFARGIF